MHPTEKEISMVEPVAQAGTTGSSPGTRLSSAGNPLAILFQGSFEGRVEVHARTLQSLLREFPDFGGGIQGSRGNRGFESMFLDEARRAPLKFGRTYPSDSGAAIPRSMDISTIFEGWPKKSSSNSPTFSKPCRS